MDVERDSVTGSGITGSGASGPENRLEPENVRAQIAALLPDLRGYARFLIRDRTAADDLVQDCVVRALAALQQFQPGSNLKAWLFTILRNSFYETSRRRRREAAALSNEDLRHATTQPDVDARAAVRDLQNLIWTLPPLLREALTLVGAQEMSYDEAALVCAVPLGTMKARVSRARTALAAAVERAESIHGESHRPGDT